MASNYNITMKQYNGADYDVLYPKTVIEQVDGIEQIADSIGAKVLAKVVGASAGTVVTATQDTTVKTAQTDSSGVATLILGYGDWVLSDGVDSKTITVDVYQIYNALVNVDTVLNNNSWTTIQQISNLNLGESFWAIGDTKNITFSGTVVSTTFNLDTWVYIIGFNHNSDIEGNGIAFQCFKTAQTGGVDICLTSFYMNSSNTNSGGWNGCYAYKTICPAIKACFPSDLQAVIKSTTLYTDNTGGGSDTASYVTANSNDVYYLADFEVYGARTYANSAEKNYQKQYKYYADGNSKIKYNYSSTTSAKEWWARSPSASSSGAFCDVGTSGGAGYAGASGTRGAAPAFKI